VIIRRRTYDNLRARISAYQAQVNDYHQRIDADRVRQSTAIVRGVRLSARLDRMVRATARYRAALAAETRRADRLQARLDNALGLDHPAIDAGAQWQDRRTDKVKKATA